MLIALGHKKGSGKSTVANILERDFGFKRMSFAKRLKECLEIIFGFNKKQLYGTDKEKIDPFWGFSARYAMTTLGDGFRELFDQNLWCKAMERDIKDALARGEKIVIDDLRYKTEAQFVKDLGGVIWKIHRPKVSNLLETIFETVVSKIRYKSGLHKSETDLDWYDKWDVTMINDSSHRELILKVHNMMKFADMHFKGYNVLKIEE